MFRKIIKSALYRAIMAYLITLFTGFGGMLLLWKILPRDNTLYGLFHYRAAFIGDSVFLPVLVATLVYYIARSGNRLSEQGLNFTRSFRTLLFTVLAIVISIGMQLSWLLDENITLNWTIPQPGLFNVAGVYHAFFFVIIITVITYLVGRAFDFRGELKKAGYNDLMPYEIVSFFLVWFSVSGFFNMLGLDNFSHTRGYFSSLIVIYVACIFFGFIIYVVFSGGSKPIQSEVICIIAGSTAAMGIGIMMIEPMIISGNIAVAIMASLFSLSFIKIDAKRLRKTSVLGFLVMILTGCATIGAVSANNIGILIIALFVPILIWVVQLIKNDDSVTAKDYRPYLFRGLALHGITIFTIGFTQYTRTYGVDVSYIMALFEGILVGVVLFFTVKSTFQAVINKEKERNESAMGFYVSSEKLKIEEDKLKKVKIVSYIWLILMGIGGLAYLGLELSQFIIWPSSYSRISISFVESQQSLIVATSLIVVCLIIILLIGNIRGKKSRGLCITVYTFMAVLYIALVYLVMELRGLFYLSFNITTVFLLFLSAGCALMMGESFYSNVIRIRGYCEERIKLKMVINKTKYDILTFIAATIIMIGTFAGVLVSTLPTQDMYGSRAQSVMCTVVGVCALIILIFVVPVVIARVVLVASNEEEKEELICQVATTKVMEGVMQSGFLTCLIAILGGSVIIQFVSLSTSILAQVVGITMIFFNVSWLLWFCMQNNVNHLKEQKRLTNERLKTSHGDINVEQYKGLAIHIRNQNAVAVFALLLYSAFILGILFFLREIKKGTDDDDDILGGLFPGKDLMLAPVKAREVDKQEE
ncbi:MAG: hypothetical protein FWE25_04285 [Lachnospiraceae bacterium]|nr:hypothetical protein [Lachnospiraceae bacterium]